MFNVTELAQQKVAEYLAEKGILPIRIFLHQGGCGGPQLAMALDEKKESDIVFEFAGVSYLVDREFLEKAKPVNVDFIETGFKISSSLALGGGCSSCGTSGTCCS